MVAGIEATLLEAEAAISMPSEFVVPGETVTSAALELARTILRRAERRAVGLQRAGMVPGEHLVPYLNRLADLLWVLARAAEGAARSGRHQHEPDPVRVGPGGPTPHQEITMSFQMTSPGRPGSDRPPQWRRGS